MLPNLCELSGRTVSFFRIVNRIGRNSYYGEMQLKSIFNLRGGRNNGSVNESSHSAVKRTVSEYVGKSSIQGVAYVGDDKLTKFERIWWFIMLVCSVLGASYLIYQAYWTMKENPIIESPSLSRTPMWEVPFSAVTLCPGANAITPSSLNETNWQDVAHISLPDNLIDLSQNYGTSATLENLLLWRSDQNNYDILRQVLPEIEIIDADFRSNSAEVGDSLQRTITIYGVCITFNMYQEKDILSDGVILSSLGHATDQTEQLWSRDSGFNDNLLEENYTYPFRSFAPADGLSIEFNVNDTKRLGRFDSNIFVTFHAPDEVPLFDRHTEFIIIKPGVTNFIEIRPQLVVSEGIEHYKPEVRQCYYSTERQLKFYRNYTQGHCEAECVANYTLVECGCVSYYLPHFNNTRLCTTEIELKCFWHEESHFYSPQFKGDGRPGHALIDNCNCLPSCTQMSYVTVRTTSLVDDKDNGSYVYVRNKSPYIKKNVRTELHSISEFFSNCGGSLGLFLGVSIFSIVELLYFCTIRLYLYSKKHSTDSNE